MGSTEPRPLNKENDVKRSILGWASVLAVLTLSMAACGDDDEATPDAAGDTTTTTADAGLAPATCEAVAALGVAFSSSDGPPTPEYLEETLLPAINEVVTVAADEDIVLDPALEAQGLIEAGAGGEEVDVDQVLAVYNDIVAPTHTDCGYEAVDVTAVDYFFEDVPASVPAGTVSIALANEGDEQHEMILFRRADGETRPVNELLELPDAEAEEALAFTAAIVVEPGQTGYGNADLEAGGYVGICFLPVGGGEEGPPHFTEGMVTEFEVA
jgi:hypothetical protein